MLTPFAAKLMRLRYPRRYRASTLSIELGHSGTFIWNLEKGVSLPPKNGSPFYEKIQTILQLSSEELADLIAAASITRFMTLQTTDMTVEQADLGVYFARHLHTFDPKQINAIKAVLDLNLDTRLVE